MPMDEKKGIEANCIAIANYCNWIGWETKNALDFIKNLVPQLIGNIWNAPFCLKEIDTNAYLEEI